MDLKRYLQIRYLIFLTLLFKSTTEAARILAVFPYPSHSHQVVHHALTQALAEHGHELTVFTTDPMNKNISNYREISLNYLYDNFTKTFNFFLIHQHGYWHFFKLAYEFSGVIADATLSHPEMQRILSPKSNEKFDLIVMATIFWDSLYYLSDRLNAPMVGITSLTGLTVHHHIMGNPIHSAYLPDNMIGYSNNMNFGQRLYNLYYQLRQIYGYHTINLPIQDKVLRKHFGADAPPIDELSQRLSMLFVNNHPFFNYPRPMVPGLLQIGGLRSGIMNKTLPTKLKTILDKSTNGFIYFSLGTNIKSAQLHAGTLKAFIQAFSELPYRIVWKFESETLEGKPDNVYISKWMPQQGVLAHPNIKLFIYQGGLQSTEEAIENGVPMLGCPVFSDQSYNLIILTKKGVAKVLELQTIDKLQIKNAIEEMIVNTSYKENILKLRELLHDRPQQPMNEAIWWIEHVIRHKGAPHLRTRARELPWYTVELVDVFAFFIVVLLLLFLLGWTLRRLAIAMIKVHTPRVLEKTKSQ